MIPPSLSLVHPLHPLSPATRLRRGRTRARSRQCPQPLGDIDPFDQSTDTLGHKDRPRVISSKFRARRKSSSQNTQHPKTDLYLSTAAQSTTTKFTSLHHSSETTARCHLDQKLVRSRWDWDFSWWWFYLLSRRKHVPLCQNLMPLLLPTV